MKKPTVKDIQELYDDCENRYMESGIFTEFSKDEKYYELDFKEKLGIPTDFAKDGVVLPTARDMIDTCVDFTNITNVRIMTNQRKGTKTDKEAAELLRKFGYGVLWRNQIESSIDPLRVSAKHYWTHGLTVLKDVWDADRSLDKPERNEGETENTYANRIDEWRYNTRDSIPIVIAAVHPSSIMLDPYFDGGEFVFETREMLVYNARDRFPLWKNYNRHKITDKVKLKSWWHNQYRCDLLDDEPILKGGVIKHDYGFIPYVPIDSGLGNVSSDNSLKKRYVGVLRYMFDLLNSESRNYSLSNILLGREVLTGGWMEGANADLVTEFSIKYGEVNRLPDGVTYHPYESKLPPQQLMQGLATDSDYISAHAAPRSTRGLSEAGVRSGSDRRLIQSQAAQRYQYSNEAFKHGVSKVLSNCARIMKNVVPGDVNVWAKTPTDEFDIEIRKDMMKEPFTFYVDFKSTSPEEDYRTHDDLERMVQTGLVTREWAREQLPNVDVKQMERQEQKNLIRMSTPYQGILIQAASGKLAQKLQGLQQATGTPPPASPVQPPQPQGQPQPMGQMTQPTQPPQMPGGPQQMQNQMQGMRSPNPPNLQGMGGGGNRHA
jgi:hypothetical protein